MRGPLLTDLSRAARGAMAGLVLLGAGACSVDFAELRPDLNKIKETVAPKDLNIFQRRQPMTALAVGADDLIGADGRCAGDPAPSPVMNFTAGPAAQEREPTAPDAPAAAAAIVRGIALGMTECEVVRLAGYTDRIEIGSNDRGQRSVVLTYATGPRPGIYKFTGGRLAVMERGPEPPPQPKRQKKGRG